MKKKELFLIILATIALVGIYTCKSTKVATNSTVQKQPIKQENTSNESNKSNDSLKYSEKKFNGCKNLMDSIKSGYIQECWNGGGRVRIQMNNQIPPIMNKVFPDVVFITITDLFNNQPINNKVLFKGEIRELSTDYNEIYNEMTHNTAITLKERVQAAVQFLVGFDKAVNILTLENQSTVLEEFKNFQLNYKAIANVSSKEKMFLIEFRSYKFFIIIDAETKHALRPILTSEDILRGKNINDYITK